MKHFKKSLTSHACNKKIHRKLEEDEIRDRILNRTLKLDEYSDRDMHEFLSLLKIKNEISKTYQLMLIE